ncbi:hypothetical protein TNCV_1792511 [Trichonephila clavipes]|nr:hypothetical protein TNCV_1792511 [Trichonephila clavipes]
MKRGGWKRLERYIMLQDYVEYYETYSAFLTYKKEEKDIPNDIMEKVSAFVSRRKHFYVHFASVEAQEKNVCAIKLILDAMQALDISIINELCSSTMSEMPSTSSLQESSISSSLSELTIKEEATPGFNQCSKASGHDGVDVAEFSYHTCLGNHIVNLKRLVSGLILNTENSNSGKTSNRAIVRLITALRCLKLKLVQVMSLLEVKHS